MEFTLQELKKEGHSLLDEYIAIDLSKNLSKRKAEAYNELEKKIKKRFNAHFSKMTSIHEVLHVHSKLRKMIHNKECALSNRSKNQFAPNLIQLQRDANMLNQHLRASNI